MEAVLDFGRGRQKWLKSCNGEYVGGGGGGGNRRGPAPLAAFIGGGCERGRGRAGRGENNFVLALNAAVCM